MPLTDIKTTPEWYPQPHHETEEGSKPQLTRDLRRALPGIVVAVSKRLGWPPVNPETVVPDILPPYHPDTARASDVPDFHIIFRPNWTKDRWEQLEQIRLFLMQELNEWFQSHRTEDGDKPTFDVDVDFVVGRGGSADGHGFAVAFWPDKIGQPFDLSKEVRTT